VRLHFLKYTFGNNSTCSSQTINVYNGPDYKAPLLHSFCNDVWPGDLISSGNEVFVYYVRRDPAADAVFRIKYSTDVPSQGTINVNANNNNDNVCFFTEKYTYIIWFMYLKHV